MSMILILLINHIYLFNKKMAVSPPQMTKYFSSYEINLLRTSLIKNKLPQNTVTCS